MEGTSRPNRFVRWYETTRRPGLVLAGIALLLYAPSFTDDFALDDYRALRILDEYHAGERARPDVYRFLSGIPEQNRAEREAGWYAWWITDDLRYQHMRPLAEWWLYGQYLVFGKHPMGYRAVSFGFYVLGMWIVMRLFRTVGHDERVARWGALIFTVAACHALPVIFISAQGDVVALVFTAAAMLAVARFLREGARQWLVVFILCLAGGIGAKEVALPVALTPLLFRRSERPAPGASRRALIALAASSVLSVAWLFVYLTGRYGSNSSLMLDPLHDPWGYLSAAPLRALLLLGTWVIPINPFLAELRPEFSAFKWIIALGGGAALLAVAVMFVRRLRGRLGVGGMALFVLMFLPILVCTPPDDRVMTLPSIGLAFLGAVWITAPRAGKSGSLRTLPVILFLVIQPLTVWASIGLMGYMESDSQRRLRIMADAFDRASPSEDHLYVINNRFAFEGLFMQDRLRAMHRVSSAGGAAILSDIADPRITVVDAHTLRLEAPTAPMLSGFLGGMGRTRSGPRREGQAFTGNGFTAKITRMAGEEVRAVELRFDLPLDSPAYRFFLIGDDGDPKPWTPRPAPERRSDVPRRARQQHRAFS